MINVGLNDVRVLDLAGSGKGRFDGIAKVNSDHVARAPARRQLRVAAFAAAAFEDDFVTEKLRLHRRNPAEKLLAVEFIALGEMLPLPAKLLRGCRLLSFYLLNFYKTSG